MACPPCQFLICADEGGVRAGTFSKLFSAMRSQFALSDGREHPLVLGAMVKPGAQPGAGISLAGLNNSRCCSRNGCYGISEHPFIASDTYARDFPGNIVNSHQCERSGLAPSRFDLLPGVIWGRSEMEGTWRKRSCALAHAHSLTFELDFKNK
jgi:hypothetical protein